MQQIAETRCRYRFLQQITSCKMWKSLSLRQNFVASICRTNSNKFEFVRQIWYRIQPCRTMCTHLRQVRQNLNQPTRKHQFVSSHVKFELVYISSLPKSITYTEQVSYRRDLSQDQCRRGDLSLQCVTVICRIVCLCLKKLSPLALEKKAAAYFPSGDVYFKTYWQHCIANIFVFVLAHKYFTKVCMNNSIQASTG